MVDVSAARCQGCGYLRASEGHLISCKGPWRHADLKPCGTLAAYRRHLRHDEQPCESCLQAGRRDWEDRSARHNAARRERYWQLREAGYSAREASSGKGRAAA